MSDDRLTLRVAGLVQFVVTPPESELGQSQCLPSVAHEVDDNVPTEKGSVLECGIHRSHHG